MRELRPLGDRLLVRPDDREATTGGIIIPATVEDRPLVGEVIRVGEGHRLADGTVLPLEVNEGDRVFYRAGAGEVPSGFDLLSIREGDVLAVIGRHVRPIRDWVVVGDLGQPNVSESGLIHFPDPLNADYHRYRQQEFRFGVIVATGEGRVTRETKDVEFRQRTGRVVKARRDVGAGRFIPYDGPPVGAVVIYRRSHGLKFAYEVGTEFGRCWARTLDQSMLIATIEDFSPWWDVEESQIHPDVEFSN